MDVVCGEVSPGMWDDLLFAWTVVKHTLSNAIVIARDGQTFVTTQFDWERATARFEALLLAGR